MYATWIKIDDTLPWIELKRSYQTKTEARDAAKTILDKIEVRIVKVPEKERHVKASATPKC